VDNFVEAIQVEKDFEKMSSCLGKEKNEILIESDLEMVISQLQDEITYLKNNKGEGKKHVKKKISTNTSLKVPPTPKPIWRNMLWIISVALMVHITLRKLVQNSLTHFVHYYFHRELLKRKIMMWSRKIMRMRKDN
jgi:hypothetical protein